ncbi:hypothetical protein HPB52_018288 [Rhipicephalus sanguineus]|uniref:Uncharacterized protein n=1 Tax=Rhipicephalus sanguineus TaxID=34632 RepID=A0A9D4SUP3_RHISA|nr:hypothetical protein HPB52_018288 [Rhipicephalus sanguineus]
MASTVSRLRDSEFPRTSYTKAVDVWTAVTLAFVIALWIDVAVVELVVRRRQGETEKKTEPKVDDENFEDADGIELVVTDKVDLVSRIVFPVAFLLFVVIYIRNYTVKVDVPKRALTPSPNVLEPARAGRCPVRTIAHWQIVCATLST